MTQLYLPRKHVLDRSRPAVTIFRSCLYVELYVERMQRIWAFLRWLIAANFLR